MMAGKILIGIDASGPSRAAVVWGIDRAGALGCAVELVHVIDTAQPSSAVGEQLLEEELSRARADAPSVAISGLLLRGRPPAVLAKHSRGFELLALGTHKTGFIFGRTFGSRFVTLAWTARCPVAFIPDLLGPSRRGIVAALDGPASATDAIDFAANEAARTGGELILLRVLAGPAAEPVAILRASRAAQAATEHARLVARATTGRALRVRVRVSERGAAEALVAASERAALLVVGRGSAGGAGSFRSLVHDILVNMASPVVIVPARAR